MKLADRPHVLNVGLTLRALRYESFSSDKGFLKVSGAWGCRSGEACLARCDGKKNKCHLLVSGNDMFATCVKVECFSHPFTGKYMKALPVLGDLSEEYSFGSSKVARSCQL